MRISLGTGGRERQAFWVRRTKTNWGKSDNGRWCGRKSEDVGLQKDENLGRETLRKDEGCIRECLRKLEARTGVTNAQKYIGEHIRVSVVLMEIRIQA